MAEPTTETSQETAPPRRSRRISARRTAAKQAPMRRRNDGGTKRSAVELEQCAADRANDGAAGDVKKAKLPPVNANTAMTTEETTGGLPIVLPTHSGDEMASINAGRDPQLEAAVSSPRAIINVGDLLPSLTLKNEKGEDMETSTLVTEKGVVLFLVPKANTPGCTQQACGFRDNWKQFTSLNFEVYCLSADSPTAQSKWQANKHLPYQLLSDPNRALIGALGAADGNKTKRSHFIFEQGGKLVSKKMPVKPADSSRLALKAIQDMQSRNTVVFDNQ